MIEVCKPGVEVHDHAILAKPGTYLRDCEICMEKSEVEAQFASFCFRTYRITGDGEQIDGPRHPGQICKTCLRAHCQSNLADGRLFVPCPSDGCERVSVAGNWLKF